MKHNLIGSVITLSVLSLPALAEEFSWGNVTFQPRVYGGYANYMLESGSFNSIYRDIGGNILEEFSGNGTLNFDLFNNDKLKINGPIFGIGATVASGQFFGDFYYQSTLNETAYSGIDTQGINGNIPYNLYRGDVDAQHDDWAISLGYMITSQWSIFGGYKSGNTEWNQPFRYNTQKDSTLISDGNLDANFDQDGPFLGTSYSFPIGPGVLTLKAAYAYLDGTYKWNYDQYVYPPFSGNDPYNSIQKVKLDGNSNAFSLGISWTQSLANNLGLSIGANYHRYKFDMSGTGSIAAQNVDYASGEINSGSLTEDLFTLTASLFYQF